MPFQPGHSGNYKGRPRKGDALNDLLNQCWSKDDRIAVIVKAIEQAKAGDDKARDFLFNRGYGKAVESVEMSGPDGDPIEYTGIDLAIAHQRIAEHLREINQRQQNEDSSDE